MVDGHDRVVGPAADGQGLGGQSFRLLQVAAQQLLARPEQGTCQAKCMDQLLGGAVVALQAERQGVEAALLQLVGHEEPAAPEGRHPVPGGLGQPHLGGGGQLGEVVRPQVAMWRSYSTAASVAGSSSRLAMATASWLGAGRGAPRR